MTKTIILTDEQYAKLREMVGYAYQDALGDQKSREVSELVEATDASAKPAAPHVPKCDCDWLYKHGVHAPDCPIAIANRAARDKSMGQPADLTKRICKCGNEVGHELLSTNECWACARKSLQAYRKP